MNKHNILFIGLDTDKVSTEVAYIEDDRGAFPIHHGKIPSTKTAIKKLIRRFESKYPKAILHFAYEAGPCGYWIYRFINEILDIQYLVLKNVPFNLQIKVGVPLRI